MERQIRYARTSDGFDIATPAEELVSDIVRSLARTSEGTTFEDRGEQALKGIAEPQQVFAVRGQE